MVAVADTPGATATPARRRLRDLGRSIVTGLSIGVLLLVVGIGVLVIGVPAAVGGMPLTILTGSMSPEMPPGTLVVVKPTPVSDIAVGDVLTYQLESGEPTLVTHRVVARLASTGSEGVSFVTQGDANPMPDAEDVLPIQVKGTVWFAVPGLGWVNQALSGAREWLVPVIVAGLLGYAAWMVVTGVRDVRRRPSPAGQRRHDDTR